MSDLEKVTITAIDKPARVPLRLVGRVEPDDLPFAVEPIDANEVGEMTLQQHTEVKFVLESVIAFLETLTLSGEKLREAGQLLRDVEALQLSL